LFDALGILFALQEAGSEIPLLPSLARRESAPVCDDLHAFEAEPGNAFSPLPPEWWIIAGGPARSGGGEHPGGTGGTGHGGPSRGHSPSPHRRTLNGSRVQDTLNGVGPDD